MSGSVKLFTFFAFVFVWGQILSYMMDSQSALQTTSLTAAIGSNTETIPVASTAGFRSNDLILIDSEILDCVIATATTFTCQRGQEESQARSHPSATRVYNKTTGYLNQLMSYNIAETISDTNIVLGTLQVVLNLTALLMNVVAQMVGWDYRFLDGHASWIRYIILYPLSGSFVASLFMAIFGRG